jgi:hypothetical protein
MEDCRNAFFRDEYHPRRQRGGTLFKLKQLGQRNRGHWEKSDDEEHPLSLERADERARSDGAAVWRRV